MGNFTKKQEIISEIKRIAEESDGKAPGFQRFSTLTGLRKSEWYPNLWLRWGDAILEAGCKPNDYKLSYDPAELISRYIDLIRELNRFPIEGELRLKNKIDKDFPSHTAFSRLGAKQDRIQKVLKYCKENEGFEDIIAHCIKASKSPSLKADLANLDSAKVGYVYLFRHGTRNEYKIGRTYNPIRREGEIRLELPEKIQPIHFIETDDPSGIESYWHSRFAKKRRNGEWFLLTGADVAAFKKWRKIY